MSESTDPAAKLVAAVQREYGEHGDNYRGMGWTKSAASAMTRYRVMLDAIEPQKARTLLDIGCGTAHLYAALTASEHKSVVYHGLDLSSEFIRLCRQKYPEREFYELDILREDVALPSFDVVVMNGLLTYRDDLDYDTMRSYAHRLITRAFRMARYRLAFNVMSPLVDWERDDLFHVGFDEMCDFVSSRLTRRFTVRHDYGLYEYTMYLDHPHAAENG